MNTNSIADTLCLIRKEKPLIHLITNGVTRNDCANIVLGIGASPIMAIDFREVEDVVSVSKALVLNIGTIEKGTVESMIRAGMMANSLNIPVILDPVGVGISQFRIDVVKRILKNIQVSIIKGNQAEIKTLCGIEANFKGVDSEDSEDNEKIKLVCQELYKRLVL